MQLSFPQQLCSQSSEDLTVTALGTETIPLFFAAFSFACLMLTISPRNRSTIGHDPLSPSAKFAAIRSTAINRELVARLIMLRFRRSVMVYDVQKLLKLQKMPV